MSANLTNNHQELIQDQQQDPINQERQLLFQRALERNIRSYIQYAQQQKILHYLFIVIVILIVYQGFETLICIICVAIRSQIDLFFILLISSISLNVCTLACLIYYSCLIYKNEIEFLEGLLWFQYDIDQKPNYEIDQIMRKSNWFCKYTMLLIVILQIMFLVLVIMCSIQTNIMEKPFLEQLVIEMIIITRVLLLLISLVIIIIHQLHIRQYKKMFDQIVYLQESEYEQLSPLNKYQVQIINENTERQFADISCIICLHNLTNKDEYYKLVCHSTHIFHKQCLQEWISHNTTCPICRTII